MKKVRFLPFLFPACLLASSSLSALETGLGEGKLLPDLILTSLEDGTPRAISSLRGGKLLLHIFASW